MEKKDFKKWKNKGFKVTKGGIKMETTIEELEEKIEDLNRRVENLLQILIKSAQNKDFNVIENLRYV